MPMAESSADGGRDQRHEQGHQHHHRNRTAGIGRVAGNGDGREDENDGEAGKQDIERDFVRRLLPLGALHQLDHAVDEGRPLCGGDADADPVAQYLRAAGDRRAVAAGFADHGRGLAGDGGFIHRSHALDHFAVGGDVVAGFDQDDIADLEAGAGDQPIGLVGAGQELGLAFGAGLLQRLGLRLAPPFGHRLGEIGEQHREPQPQDDLEGEAEVVAAREQVAQEDHRGQRGHDLDHEHHGTLDHQPRIELGEGCADRRDDDLRIKHRRNGHPLVEFLDDFHGRNSGMRSVRTRCWRCRRGARRSGRAPAPGRRSGRR